MRYVTRHANGFNPRDLVSAGLQAVTNAQDLRLARSEVAKVGVGPEVTAYIVDLVRATRVSPSLSLGVSPRGATALLATSRAWLGLTGALCHSRDVKNFALPTLRHRIKLRPEAELEGVSAASVIDGVLRMVAVPR